MEPGSCEVCGHPLDEGGACPAESLHHNILWSGEVTPIGPDGERGLVVELEEIFGKEDPAYPIDRWLKLIEG